MTYCFALSYQMGPRSWKDVFSVFFDITNPIYVSVFAVTVILFVIYFTYRYIVNPLQKKFTIEKENLELQAARLMALFAELDPDPMIRIDSTGKIIITNDAAEKVFHTEKLKESDINSHLNLNKYNITDIIDNNSLVTFTQLINGKHYSILLRGNSALRIAQIYFRDISEQKFIENKLKDSEIRLKELSDHLQDILEAERYRISAALHDGIGQSLSLLRLNLHNIPDNRTGEFSRPKKENLIELLDSAIKELKDISYGLKPKLLEQMGLEFALERLVNGVAADMKIKGTINIIGRSKRLSPKVELILFRIAQESMNNIIKHSGATEFNVQLLMDKKLIRMIISDNGKGFDAGRHQTHPEKHKGMGLLNIAERVSSLNGIFKIESSRDNGTMLVIEIPQDKKVWQRNKVSA